MGHVGVATCIASGVAESNLPTAELTEYSITSSCSSDSTIPGGCHVLGVVLLGF